MNDKEKFESMKRQVIQENEAAYGAEVRSRYGETAAAEADARLAGMSQQEWEQMIREEEDCKAALRRAVETGDAAGAAAREAVALHAAWLAHTWSQVTPQGHMAMAELYVQDPRFTAYYEQAVPGGAAFLAEAIRAYYQS